MTQTSSNKHMEIGLLILRMGIGIMMAYHGYSKITGGPEAWVGLGGVMGIFGINFFPAFWGFMAAVTEFFGGIFIALGLFTKPTALFLIITMFVAASLKFNSGGGLFEASHAIELGIVFLSLIFIGPGRYSIEKKVWPSPTQS